MKPHARKFTGFAWLGVLLPWITLAHAAEYKTADLPKEVVVHGVEFILIPEGWFYKSGGVAGPNNDDPRFTQNYAKIWLDSFYIAKYEARARDFARFMNEEGEKHPGLYSGDKEGCSVRRNENGEYFLFQGKARDLPATHLSWELADAWARWMGFRLPSEAEWEKAARGSGDKRTFPWGDEPPDDTRTAFLGGISCNPVPVDRYAKGVSPYGVYNMAGNVREYVADWWNDEADVQLKDGIKNPPLPVEGKSRHFDAPQKMLKGGRWMIDSSGLKIKHRDEESPQTSFICNGTRFAADVDTILKAMVKQP